jgi:hypothetical protein
MEKRGPRSVVGRRLVLRWNSLAGRMYRLVDDCCRCFWRQDTLETLKMLETSILFSIAFSVFKHMR